MMLSHPVENLALRMNKENSFEMFFVPFYLFAFECFLIAKI